MFSEMLILRKKFVKKDKKTEKGHKNSPLEQLSGTEFAAIRVIISSRESLSTWEITINNRLIFGTLCVAFFFYSAYVYTMGTAAAHIEPMSDEARHGQDLFQQRYMAGFIFSAILIAVISFIDDVWEKSALFKLATHVVAVGVVLYSGIVIDSLSVPWADSLPLGIAGFIISFFWILGLTNAYNFMDGIDGLVASTALITGIFFMAISYYEGSTFVYITSYTIIAGAVGFLVYNAPPAKIFMGDVGSAFLGFVFATLAIIAARYDESHTSFLVMPMLLLHFIFDTLFTFVRRVLNGQNPLKAHRTHLYQLRVRSGHTHLDVTLMLSCMAFLQGLGALWMVNIPGNERLFVFIPFIVLQADYAMLTLKRARKRGVTRNGNH